MKILVIGSGGREHSLVKAFKLSPQVTEIHALPGSDGMAQEALCHPEMDWRNYESVVNFCISYSIDFVMIGPEEPCVLGLSDFLRERGIFVVAPDRQAAQLEGSKIFSKDFMLRAGVPTARSLVVESVSDCLNQAHQFTPPYVLKADGLCAGKGVFICESKEELLFAATELFEKKVFGQAGERALLEQFTPGYEMSVLLLTNGFDFQLLPIAQDHKRLNDGQKGPNTGGMGTVAPLEVAPELMNQIVERIVRPSVQEIKKSQMLYRGILFIGLMINENGPSVLEYNTRLGDPETQVILPLVDYDLAELFYALSKGNLNNFRFKAGAAACVVKTASGYPESPEKGDLIHGLPESDGPSSWVIHAGTRRTESGFVTHGGRVLGCVGIGVNIQKAVQNAYELSAQIHWRGCHQRSDIGKN
ncbi:MAG: phosphoribosylamine--glycine ligase [Bdellovibrionales bacterium]